jgi:hypothetical protein
MVSIIVECDLVNEDLEHLLHFQIMHVEDEVNNTQICTSTSPYVFMA